MNTIYAKKMWLFVFFGLMPFFAFNIFAQVEIGTVNPNGLLDVQIATQLSLINGNKNNIDLLRNCRN